MKAKSILLCFHCADFLAPLQLLVLKSPQKEVTVIYGALYFFINSIQSSLKQTSRAV